MERLYILVTGLAKMTAPSFKNLPGRLSVPAALEMSMFFNSFRATSSVVGFNWNLVVMFKVYIFVKILFYESMNTRLVEVEVFIAMFLPY